MDDLHDLRHILEISVQRNGEKPLTNKWLLNIVNKSIQYREHQAAEQDKNDIILENQFSIY